MTKLDLTPQQLDVTVYVHGAWSFSLAFTDQQGGALDLTAEDVTLVLRNPDTPDSTLVTLADGEGLSWVNRAGGTLTVAPTPAQLAATTQYNHLTLEVWRAPQADGAQPFVEAKGATHEGQMIAVSRASGVRVTVSAPPAAHVTLSRPAARSTTLTARAAGPPGGDPLAQPCALDLAQLFLDALTAPGGPA